ncbi:MAG: ABC transporter ATP-binding protein [Lachnospiraceae bacterium]
MIRIIRQNLTGVLLFVGLLAPLCMLLEVLMDLQMPTLMSNIIDIGVAAGDMDYVLRTGLRMIVYAILGLVGGAGCSLCSNFASFRMGGRLRKRLFSHIFTLSAAEVDQLEPSGLVTRMTDDITRAQDMVVQLLRGMSRAPMQLLGCMIMSFVLSPKLALIMCVVMPVLIIVAVLIIRLSIPMYTTVQDRMDKVNTVMRENLLGIRVVKAFTLEMQQTRQFTGTNESYAKDSIKAQNTSYLLMPIVTLIMNLSVVAVLWFGGLMQISGNLPMGRILAFINYMVQISNSLLMLVNASLSLSRARASSLRILQVLDTQPSVAEAEKNMEPSGSDITFEHVTFGYSDSESVLSDISLHIDQGKRVGIIGATGCGKSTLAALAARLYESNTGIIYIGGVDVREIPTRLLRQKVGIVLQDSLLFSGSVSENLRYGNPDASPEELWNAVDDAAAAGFLRALPDGLDAKIAQRGKNFSGGQKQRLSIARSLLHGPDILIVDDSTSAVDLLTEARLQHSISQRMKDSTVILIAQRISSIMDCDDIFVMDKGQIINRGKHSELLKSCDIYRSIALSQLGEEVLYA